jgi:hypothetical protein
MAKKAVDTTQVEETKAAQSDAPVEPQEEATVVFVSRRLIDRTYVMDSGKVYAPSDEGKTRLPKELADYLGVVEEAEEAGAQMVAEADAEVAATPKKG